ncbi:MAG: hypothetical protein AAF211_21105, partial [Myxococcota bacterium]
AREQLADYPVRLTMALAERATALADVGREPEARHQLEEIEARGGVDGTIAKSPVEALRRRLG